ncbi:hypothetical protein U91I_02750 [alpha proteobacterium U9-1i]|nr:hypothetical protein U91I_02750 [alpha proteobacterium U9-1i]
MDVRGLLEHASLSNRDLAFAGLCSTALDALARYEAAEASASQSANAATVRAEARAAYLELDDAADAAHRAMRAALKAIMDHPSRNASAALTKLHIRRADDWCPDNLTEWSSIVADIECALRCARLSAA